MPVGAIGRGDLVVVHSTRHNLQGLYVVDSVGSGPFGANTVKVADPYDAGNLSGGDKSKVIPLDKTVDIFAVHTAATISA
jgi:hypothetical protein